MRPSQLPDARMIARSAKTTGPAILRRGFIPLPLNGSRASTRTPVAKASHLADKSRGTPTVLLSDVVCEQEALILQHLCEGLQRQATCHTILQTELAAEVHQAARAVLGSSARAFIDGSMVKGTQWRGSDVDILVLTDQPVTRSQFLALAEKMKESPMFHPRHVDPGNLAIHVRTGGMDIDVVCANTVEHGIRPLAEERFADNPTAGNAARILKVMAAHAQSAAPIKNYHLELLTLLAQDAAAARGGARVADGSMQLVLDVLQSIADDKMPTASAAVTQDDLSEDQFKGLVSRLKDHVQKVLHLFFMSHELFSPGGWRSSREVQSWLFRPVEQVPTLEVPTKAGLLPRWLVDLNHDPPVGGRLIKDLLDVGGPDKSGYPSEEPGTDPESKSGTQPESHEGTDSKTEPGYSLTRAQSKQVEQILQGPLGKYTLLGRSFCNAVATDGESLADAFNAARRAAAASLILTREERKGRSEHDFWGDVPQLKDLIKELQSEPQRRVAKCMLEARELWIVGEKLLERGRSITAIRTLAKALRFGCRDGDPFSGIWTVEKKDGMSTYEAAVNAAKSSCPADALLVLAYYQMQRMEVELAEQACNEGLKHAPDDACGLLQLRASIHGNRSEWDLALRDYDRAVSLVPSEPIFYFWRGVCRRNMIGGKEAAEQIHEQEMSGDAGLKLMSLAGEDEQKRMEWMRQSGEAKKDFEHFLSLADEGGRKVPEAHYDIGWLSFTFDGPKRRSSLDEVIERVNAARASESLVLPMLQSETCSDSKQCCNVVYSFFDAPDNPPTMGFNAADKAPTTGVGMMADILSIPMNQIARSDDFHSKITAKQSAEKEAAEAAKWQRQMHNATSQIDPSSLNCWPRVMFKEAVRIVDPDGGGHFAQLSDAVEYVCSTPPPTGSSGWTLVLQPGKYMQCQMVLEMPTVPGGPAASSQHSLQVLGGRTTATEASPHDEYEQEPNPGIQEPEVTLVYGHPGPESRKRPVSIEHLASVHGLSVWMEDLTLVVPHIPGISSGHHCI